MNKFILTDVVDRVGIITLNRPEKLNAWNAMMRDEIIVVLKAYDADPAVSAIIMTGSGDRAFCSGQDLEEAMSFDVARSTDWMHEWENYYGVLRHLTKPLIMALNGLAAGSAFQVALLGDIRVGHPGVSMGQPEINSGICSVTGPWIMREMLGMSRTTELTLTGRLMPAEECHHVGILHHVVAASEVMPTAMAIAKDLASKPPVAFRLNKQRLAEMTEASFLETIEASIRIHAESYATGEPHRVMAEFYSKRAK